MRRSEIVGLQYLRGIAAIAVVLDHVVVNAAFPKYFGPDPAWMFLRYGARGVDLFFAISGFIITVVSLEGAGARPAIGLRAFFARRFARIVPMMWLSILSYLALQLLFRHDARSLAAYVNALFLLPGEILPPRIWTLRQELLFYVLFAVAMLTVRPARWLLPLWLLPLWFGACLVWLLGAHPVASNGVAGIVLNPRNLGFGAGMLVALAWLRWPAAWRWRVPVEPLLLLALGFVGVIAVLVLGAPLVGRQVLVLGIALFGLLVAGAVGVECPPGPWRRTGELLGAASYSIYLFHSHAVSGSLGVLARLAPGMPRTMLVLIVFAAATAFGIVVHLLVERPVVRLARRLMLRRPASSPTVPPDDAARH